jgi:predicted phage replisome organizer
MSDNKRFYWLKLKNDFFSQKEIKKLRRIAGGDTYTIIYLKMQLISLKDNGKIYFDGIEDTFAEELALEIDEDPKNVEITLLFLEKCGFIEKGQENEYSLPQTRESIGSETSCASRVRRHRQKEKELQCNGTVTIGNTEKEKEKEKEPDKELETKKDINKKKIYPFDDYTSNNNLMISLNDFVKMRKQIKAPMTDRAISLLLSNLDKLADNDAEKIEILNQSIMNSWKGIFPLKNNFTKNNAYENPQAKMTREAIEMIRNG